MTLDTTTDTTDSTGTASPGTEVAAAAAHHHGYISDKDRYLTRMKRIEGQARGIAKMIDESNDPNLAPWDLCEGVFRKGADLGFTSLLLPKEYGGMGGKCIDLALIQEELGVADVSIACSYFNLTAAMTLFVARAGTEEQRKRILSHVSSGEPHLFSVAESEPNVASSDLFCPAPDPKIGMKTFAHRDGDTYVINGNKSALITSAGIADAYFIMARTDLDKPLREGMSMFYILADTPGLKFGKKTEMIGWKPSHHAELLSRQRAGACVESHWARGASSSPPDVAP